MRKAHKPYNRVFIVATISLVIVVLAVFGAVLFSATKNLVETQLGINAQGVAVAASMIVMEDIEGYKQFIETKDMESDYYKKMQAYFAEIKKESNIKFIFTERRIDADTIEFVLDSEPVNTSEHSPAGSTGPNDWKREVVYETKAPANFKLFNHPIWGKIISSYAPIFDRDGTFLGILGINIDSTVLFDRLTYVFTIMLVTVGCLVGVILLLLIRFSSFFLEPALKDKLTGAYNRRYFEKYIQAEIKNAIKNGNRLLLMMLDLDHFKDVNDRNGHTFGDRVLREVARVIRDTLRKDDCFVRYGGEEFIVILSNMEMENGVEVAERIRKAVENTTIYNEEKNTDVRITVSIGLAGMTHVNIGVKELIAHADKAMYDAKKTRNAVSVYGWTPEAADKDSE